MVKPRKLTGTEKSLNIIRIILYSMGIFIALMILLGIFEYFGFLTELRLKFAELFNI